jgi:uncharacterized protein (UPF0548 family)
LGDLALNYPDVGATSGPLPSGYAHVRRSKGIGHGTEAYEAASARLLAWELHRGAGLRVLASHDSAVERCDVLLGIGPAPLRLAVPCRVVREVDEPDRCGFAYGTLHGHPEAGEEEFLVRIGDDGTVEVVITAFSRPATWWARLGSPVARRAQTAVTSRYLSALQS